MAEFDSTPTKALRIERDYSVPAKRVFAAWTTEGDLQRWAWGGSRDQVRVEADPCVGGAYRFTVVRSTGETWAYHGIYLDIVPYKRISCTLEWDPAQEPETNDEKLTVEFLDNGNGTTMVFLHEGIPNADIRSKHRINWNDAFNALGILLRQSPTY